MKNAFKLILLLLLPIHLLAQKKIDFRNSMEEATKIAVKKGKPILVFIESPTTKVESMIGLNDPEVIALINTNFIPFKLLFSDPEARVLTKKYPMLNRYPAFVFLHANKELFFNDYGNWNSKVRYIKMINDALTAAQEKTLASYESEYLANTKDPTTLKAFILARQQQGITNNADLIEAYTNLLTSADFNDYATVLFILKAGPYADGNAYKLVYTNRDVVSSIYKKEPIEVRSAINRNILLNTMAHAKQTKDLKQAEFAASFSRRINGNGKDGIQSYDSQLLSYYLAVNDTTNYLKNAIKYYDAYFMNLSADSIKKLEIKQQQIAFNRTKPVNPPSKLSQAQIDSLKALPTTVVRRQSFTSVVPSMANNYANMLNAVAYKFYEIGTKNINYLTKAMIWSRRALELHEEASYYDTLAHILYRLGYYSEASKTQETAINKAKIDGRPYENMQAELRKMKSREI